MNFWKILLQQAQTKCNVKVNKSKEGNLMKENFEFNSQDDLICWKDERESFLLLNYILPPSLIQEDQGQYGSFY